MNSNMMTLYTCSSKIIESYDRNDRQWAATLIVNIFMLHALEVVCGKHAIYRVRIYHNCFSNHTCLDFIISF